MSFIKSYMELLLFCNVHHMHVFGVYHSRIFVASVPRATMRTLKT